MKGAKGFHLGRRQAATDYLDNCRSLGPPRMFEYICDQLVTLGCPGVESNTFVSDLAPVAYPYAATPSLQVLPTVVPETDTPVPASVATSLLSSTTRTRDDDQYWARDWYKLIDQVSRTPSLKLPSAREEFAGWERIFASEVRGGPWSTDSVNILQQASTTAHNASLSKDLATLLNKCAIHGGASVHHELLSGPGAGFLSANHGIELWTHVHRLYNPTGARSLWDYSTAWASLSHKQQESVPSLAHRLTTVHEQLAACGLTLPNIALKMRLAQCVCQGPYHLAFDSVYQGICVTQAEDWRLPS
jgi:hypothetical protein